MNNIKAALIAAAAIAAVIVISCSAVMVTQWFMSFVTAHVPSVVLVPLLWLALLWLAIFLTIRKEL